MSSLSGRPLGEHLLPAVTIDQCMWEEGEGERRAMLVFRCDPSSSLLIALR